MFITTNHYLTDLQEKLFFCYLSVIFQAFITYANKHIEIDHYSLIENYTNE